MEITTPVLALLIAVLSLVLSLHTGVTTRRANQLQRLASIRTKLSGLMWKIQFDLSQYERCARQLDQLCTDEETTWAQDTSFLKEGSATIAELKSCLDSISSTLSKFPLTLGAGRIDEIEHRVDSITEGVSLASEKLLPRMMALAKRIESAPSGDAALPNPAVNTDAAR